MPPRLHCFSKKAERSNRVYSVPQGAVLEVDFVVVLPGNRRFTECLLTYEGHCTPGSKEVVHDHSI